LISFTPFNVTLYNGLSPFPDTMSQKSQIYILCIQYFKYPPDCKFYILLPLSFPHRILPSDILYSILFHTIYTCTATYKRKVHNGKIEIISFVVKFRSCYSSCLIKRYQRTGFDLIVLVSRWLPLL
jgi:hypothetical protein